MKSCFPAFVIHLLGIKADLQDAAAWRALGVFVLWVTLIQLGCFAWHKLHRQQGMQQLGVHCLLLTTNNTGFIGWPVLMATVGAKGAAMSMLLSVLLFVQLLPVAVACFEYQRFMEQGTGESHHGREQAADKVLPVSVQNTTVAAAAAAAPAAALQKPGHAAPTAATQFTHEFRYCFWSNADYVPSKLQSPLMWLNFLAIAISLSGLRRYLDPASPAALPALGFIDGLLNWFSSACIPVLLFANGVWMSDKQVFSKQGQLQVTQLLLLKLLLLPALMVALTLLCGMRDEYGLGLVLLSACPLAQLAFLMCHQYHTAAELATSLTIQGVLLMLPHMIALIKLCQLAQLYDVSMLNSA
ncbi:hypothetical protein OEZ85_000795 [Tetradesmus obliquus]|uniref:Auxin efflux carrier component n=1 Tax=Tetradesmus obliquus TaxID=3088 RepID=A0ABY8UJE7_TETOB|nr:hypothetical protein OEZ85_000795 [Tetradesmus obliquus]